MTPLVFNMTDEQWFADIEASERRKRRQSQESNVVEQAVEGLRGLLKDLKDGFSLPKGASIKYASF